MPNENTALDRRYERSCCILSALGSARVSSVVRPQAAAGVRKNEPFQHYSQSARKKRGLARPKPTKDGPKVTEVSNGGRNIIWRGARIIQSRRTSSRLWIVLIQLLRSALRGEASMACAVPACKYWGSTSTPSTTSPRRSRQSQATAICSSCGRVRGAPSATFWDESPILRRRSDWPRPTTRRTVLTTRLPTRGDMETASLPCSRRKCASPSKECRVAGSYYEQLVRESKRPGLA